MANVTILNGTSSTVGGAAIFTAAANTRLLINFVRSSGSTITIRWGNSVNYNQVTSSDMQTIGRSLAMVYISKADTRSSYYRSYRLTSGFHAASDAAGMTTTMAYPLEIYLKSGEIFDMTCGAYSVMAVTE